MSYFGAGPDHGVAEDDSFFAYADAKTTADVALAQSDLDWTILRPSGLTLDAATGRIATSLDGATKGSVSRAPLPSPWSRPRPWAGPALAGCHRRVQQRRDTRRRGVGGVRTDFGIARAADASGHTRAGDLLGTPLNLSPEQALGRPATGASDLYALGVVGDEMLSGDQTVRQTDADRHRDEPHPRGPSPLPADVPEGCWPV